MALPTRRLLRWAWCLFAVAVAGALPWLIIEFKRHDWEVQMRAWFIAGLVVLVTLPVTAYEVAMHLEYWSRPKLQIRVIRILWMVPIYSVDAWFCLGFQDARIYLDVIREFYEAFVIYNFFMYLLLYLEDTYGNVDAFYSTKEDVEHIWGFQYILTPWRMGHEFFWQCKTGVLSYVILRPLMTLTAFIAEQCGVYQEGQLRLNNVYLYTTLVNNFSQLWALYCLILMFMATKEQLAPIRPLSKFVVVKAVVFFSFWQSVVIAILAWVGIIQSKEWKTYSKNDVAAGLQSFLICIEMFFAALAHAYAFPPRDYMDPTQQPPPSFMHSLRIMFDVRDVVDDVQGVMDDTVQRTTDNITDLGRRSWRQARRTGSKIQPKKIMRMFDRAGRPANFEDAGHARSFSDENDLEDPLLSRSQPAPHEAGSAPGPAEADLGPESHNTSSSLPPR